MDFKITGGKDSAAASLLLQVPGNVSLCLGQRGHPPSCLVPHLWQHQQWEWAGQVSLCLVLLVTML